MNPNGEKVHCHCTGKKITVRRWFCDFREDLMIHPEERAHKMFFFNTY